MQDLDNSVPLITNKRTFVRFHVHSVAGTYETTARLHAQSGSQTVELAPQNRGGMITVQPDPNRAVLDHAFLFALPSSFESGTVQLTAELNPGGDPVETNLVNNSAEATVTFEDVPQQNLVLYSVGYGPENQPYYPPDIDRTQMGLWLQRAFPLNDLQVTERSYFSGSGVPTCGQVNSYLLSKRLWDLAFNPDLPGNTRYYGMISDAAGFIPGCAVSVPGFVASGPTGMPSADRFGWDTDGSYGDWYGAHELAHAWGRPDAPFCGATSGSYPYPNGRISPTLSGNNALYGFDVFTRAIYEPSWKDVMSFCEYQWVSDVTYTGLLDFYQSETVTVGRNVNRTDRLLVVGTIDAATDAVALQPLFIFPNTGELKPRVAGDYAIVLRNAAGTVLQRYPVTPDTGVGGDAERNVSVRFINELVPYVAGTAHVDIEHAGIVRETVAAGINVPAVQIVSAGGGSAAASGETVTLSWEANDADGDALSFNVQYSTDGGLTWEMIEQNIPANGPDCQQQPTGAYRCSKEIASGNLPRSAQARFRVLATDGIHSTGGDSADFGVATRVPTAAITEPKSGLAVRAGATLVLTGTAFDSGVGTMKDEQLQWTATDRVSGNVTFLGTGAQLAVATCPVGCTSEGPCKLCDGDYDVTFEANDGVGGVATTPPVRVVVTGEPVMCAPQADQLIVNGGGCFVSFDTASGNTSAQLSVNNNNCGYPISFTASVDQPWVRLASSAGTTTCDEQCEGTTPATITTVFRNTGLDPGRYTATITFSSPSAAAVTCPVEVGVACTGDCSRDDAVTVDEIATMLNIALGFADTSACFAGDANGDKQITVNEIQKAAANALNGCH